MDTEAPEAINLAKQIAAELFDCGWKSRRGWFLRRRMIRHTVTPVENPSGGKAASAATIRLVVQSNSDDGAGGEVRIYQVSVVELIGAV